MKDKNDQKHENEHEDSMIDLDVSVEQAEQARAGDGSGFYSEYKYIPVRK